MKHLFNVDWLRNFALVTLLLLTILFTAYVEGYLATLCCLLWVIFLPITVVLYWLAWNISTPRLLGLIVGIFILEYFKETIGIRSGMWQYQYDSYNFGVWGWVLGGMTIFCLTTRIVIPGLRMLMDRLPRRACIINPIIVVFIFALIPITLGPYWKGDMTTFWGFYLILLLWSLMTALRMDPPVFFGILITTWIFGFPFEYVGSIPCKVWTFTHNPDFPPMFLVLGCWPLEILSQYSLSAFFANEPLDKYTYKYTYKKGGPA